MGLVEAAEGGGRAPVALERTEGVKHEDGTVAVEVDQAEAALVFERQVQSATSRSRPIRRVCTSFGPR